MTERMKRLRHGAAGLAVALMLAPQAARTEIALPRFSGSSVDTCINRDLRQKPRAGIEICTRALSELAGWIERDPANTPLYHDMTVLAYVSRGIGYGNPDVLDTVRMEADCRKAESLARVSPLKDKMQALVNSCLEMLEIAKRLSELKN